MHSHQVGGPPGGREPNAQLVDMAKILFNISPTTYNTSPHSARRSSLTTHPPNLPTPKTHNTNPPRTKTQSQIQPNQNRTQQDKTYHPPETLKTAINLQTPTPPQRLITSLRASSYRSTTRQVPRTIPAASQRPTNGHVRSSSSSNNN